MGPGTLSQRNWQTSTSVDLRIPSHSESQCHGIMRQFSPSIHRAVMFNGHNPGEGRAQVSPMMLANQICRKHS